MYRLIIVDNEPNIVRGMKQLLTEEAPFELDVYGAYSAEEALLLLEKVRIDIALLDIRMPGMNGLELQETILQQWPQCRVIFLTGYNDFVFVQTALRNGSVDYILKMDGDEAILQAIGKAVDDLSRATELDHLLEQARDKLQQSLASLQKDYVHQLINGLAVARQQRMDQLQIPLNAAVPPLLVIARVDRWDPSHTDSDKALMYYAIQNIAGEYWTGCRHLSSLPDSGELVALIQTEPEGRWNAPPDRWVRYVHGQLESIQEACKQYLRLSVSFVAGSKPVEWESLPVKYEEMKQILFYGFGQRSEMLLTDEVYLNFRGGGRDMDETVLKAQNKLRHLLSSEMMLGLRTLADFDELARLSRQLSQNTAFLNEMYHGIAYTLLAYLNKNDLWKERSASEYPFNKLYSLEIHSSWEDALEYLRETIDYLLQARNQESDDGAHMLIAKLKTFIDHHLGEDLSLVRLSEVVYLNPTYLSRLFKQQTGQGVSQYITELRINKSRELLKYSKLKIKDIASKVGFDSATSFGRFFKRETNSTPQEYRDSYS